MAACELSGNGRLLDGDSLVEEDDWRDAKWDLLNRIGGARAAVNGVGARRRSRPDGSRRPPGQMRQTGHDMRASRDGGGRGFSRRDGIRLCSGGSDG